MGFLGHYHIVASDLKHSVIFCSGAFKLVDSLDLRQIAHGIFVEQLSPHHSTTSHPAFQQALLTPKAVPNHPSNLTPIGRR